ncbi:MAG TPA: translation initiation factor IF-2 [Planctomycetota bacterium]|nr:translation initiation factor IF-2 [Planctomycetota bacterium]
MRVAELAKELGFKAAELVEMVKDHAVSIPIANPRGEIDARSAAQIRAKLPHRRNLKGELAERYGRVVVELAAQEAAKPEGKPERKKKPAAEGEEGAPKKKTVRKKIEGEAPADAAAKAKEEPAKAEAAKAPTKKSKVVQEFRLSDVAGKAEKPKPAPTTAHIGLTPEERAALLAQTKDPLIDVDKVIGVEHEVRTLRTAEAAALDRDKAVQEDKLHRHVVPRSKPPSPPVRPSLPAARAPVPIQIRPKPRIPAPHVRPTVQPPKPRPVVVPIEDRDIELTVPISIKDFCEKLGIKSGAVMRSLIEKGVMATINATLSEEQVVEMALQFNRPKVKIVRQKSYEEVELAGASEKDRPEDLVPRAPVVVFMGHVDHGKTSLLDRIRNTNVAAGESGGITQHIGASKVLTKDGKPVVFLDTPGHEAFTAMRARGANVTDVAVIVVAADDGVMPQTEEAINHAKAAGVKIMVALNKIDKPQANPNKVKGQLAALGLQTEDWGGTTTSVEVSALTGQGVDQLVEMLSLEAELLDLKANPKRPASGAVLEARKTEDRGIVATVLVQNGTLRKGDVLLAGRAFGRVRAMHDSKGKSIPEAPPSTPIEVTGFDDPPDAGNRFNVLDSIDKARQIASERSRKERATTLLERQHLTLESLFSKIESGKLKEVRVILKVDVQGSAEVLKEALQGMSTEEVKLRLLHASVGAITESDVILADASDAIIIGFHVEPEERARQLAKEKGVDIRLYDVIYKAIEEMQAALEGLLEPEEVEVKTGHASVKQIFRISRVGTIAGCAVTDGKIGRGDQVRLIRNGKVTFTGKLESLKRIKDDVKEVVEGYECGIKLAGHDDVIPGDIIETFQIQKVARKLSKK